MWVCVFKRGTPTNGIFVGFPCFCLYPSKAKTQVVHVAHELASRFSRRAEEQATQLHARPGSM